jgi:hypothetical protein
MIEGELNLSKSNSYWKHDQLPQYICLILISDDISN